jgi:hypothetical protein
MMLEAGRIKDAFNRSAKLLNCNGFRLEVNARAAAGDLSRHQFLGEHLGYHDERYIVIERLLRTAHPTMIDMQRGVWKHV